MKKTTGRGYARWAGTTKEERSKEMSKVAKGLWKKIRAGELSQGEKLTKIDAKDD